MKLGLMGCLLLWTTTIWAGIEVSVMPEKVGVGETVRLTLSLDGANNQGVPDVTPLRRDFDIVGTEHSSQYTLVNGHGQSLTQWIILISPKHEGVLPIPPIHLGSVVSQATTIEVTATADASASDDEALRAPQAFLRAEVDLATPYLHQQVIYTVKLYHRGQLLDAVYEPPHVDDALLFPMGPSHRYQAHVHHQTYDVEAQRYALFPQKSGALTITPPELQALVYEHIPKRIRIHGKSIVLNVKPEVPNASGQTWLPAKNMSLSEHYSSSLESLHQGDTVVRQVDLKAWGLPSEWLPTLTFSSTAAISAYPDKPKNTTHMDGDDLLGQASYQITYVLHDSGVLKIPAVVLSWFNLKTGAFEQVRLPEHQIVVAANRLKKPAKKIMPKPVVQNSSSPMNQWAWFVAIGFALLWLSTIYVFWLHPRFKKRLAAFKRVDSNALRKACLSHSPIDAQKEVLLWAQKLWPDLGVKTLSDVMNLSGDEVLHAQLEALSQALYQRHQKNDLWQGNDLWKAICGFKKSKKILKKTKSQDLPPLNDLV